MKYSLYVIMFVCFFTCCNPVKKNEEENFFSEERYQLLKTVVEESDTLYTIQYDTTIFHLDGLINYPLIHEPSRMIYIINSECSVCIGEFMDFIFHLQKSQKDLPIMAIINAGDKETLKYNVEPLQSKYNIKLVFFENINNQYVDDLLEKQNGNAFYLFKNRVINKFFYEL